MRLFLDDLDDSAQQAEDTRHQARFENGLSHGQRLAMELPDVGSVCPDHCRHPHHILKADTPPLVVGSTTRARRDETPAEEVPLDPKELERMADEILSNDAA